MKNLTEILVSSFECGSFTHVRRILTKSSRYSILSNLPLFSVGVLFERGNHIIDCLRAQITRTKTQLLAIIFRVPITCVSPLPKPLYLNGIVTYEDDQKAIFHSNFTQIHFPISKIIFCCHLHLQLK